MNFLGDDQSFRFIATFPFDLYTISKAIILIQLLRIAHLYRPRSPLPRPPPYVFEKSSIFEMYKVSHLLKETVSFSPPTGKYI